MGGKSRGEKSRAEKSGPQTSKNEGEGSRTAARAYDKHAGKHARSGDVGKEAKAAAQSLGGREGPALKQAEDAGKAKAREESPAVKRDYKHKA